MKRLHIARWNDRVHQAFNVEAIKVCQASHTCARINESFITPMDTSPVFRHAGLAEKRLRLHQGPGEAPAMPLPKQIDDEHENTHSVLPFGSLAEMGRAAFAYAGGLMGLKPATSDPQPDVPRVGKYIADYSELTPEEIANVDPACAELFKRSKPVSR